MLLDHAFPPDLRVENEARTLVDAGYSVTILAMDPDDRPSEWLDEHLWIERARVSRQLRNKMRGLAATFPIVDWVAGRLVRQLHRFRPIHALHAHDLYLFGAALRAGKKLGVPVVGDMHENWVEALKHYRWSTMAPGKWVVNLKKWKHLEMTWSLDVDRLIVVIDEMAERMQSEGVPGDRMVVVPNTIQRAAFDAWPERKSQDMPDGRPFLLYTGGMDGHRGIEDPIRAMPLILERLPEAHLVLVGDGAVRSDLESLAAELGVQDAVSFLGWKAQEDVRGYMLAADVGLIPHRKTVHTDHTIPHKLFHYMHAGLPCLVSNCKPLERIVTAEQCGCVYPSGEPAELARKVIEMLGTTESAEALSDMARRGREAVASRWNWEATASPLVEAYRELLPID
ncbi:MAG: glycosyltransferase family 4 protein [Bacteroidota bacterium]|nr:glycosyltransferase family 4 protein [Bacteroidota bacterium]